MSRRRSITATPQHLSSTWQWLPPASRQGTALTERWWFCFRALTHRRGQLLLEGSCTKPVIAPAPDYADHCVVHAARESNAQVQHLSSYTHTLYSCKRDAHEPCAAFPHDAMSRLQSMSLVQYTASAAWPRTEQQCT